MTLLQLGDYPRGFAEYEWRPQAGRFAPGACPHPRWDGRPIPERTLLIHIEQGAGDAIQFARYLPLAAQRVGRLLLACRADLVPLFATIPGVAEVREAETIGVADFDAQLPLLSLPHVFGTRLETIPAHVPYLDLALLRRRKDSRPSLPPSDLLQVGLVWAGSSTHPRDRQRSCVARDFLPALRTPGIVFHSVQTGERSEELPRELGVRDLPASVRDFGDTALLIDQLDLLITVDTAAAHLAGALGKPVWTLLGTVPDWRWGLEGETTPWYPSMRLFRQTRSGDWAGVMERVAHALAEWVDRQPSKAGGRALPSPSSGRALGPDATKCHSKAVAKGIAPDPGCFTKADATFSAGWVNAEAAGDCLTPTGDEAAIEAQVDAFLDDVVTDLVNAPGPSKCTSKKLTLAGKKASSRLKCHAKAAARGVAVDPACLQKAADTFTIDCPLVAGITPSRITAVGFPPRPRQTLRLVRICGKASPCTATS
jgi:hypothetical protein